MMIMTSTYTSRSTAGSRFFLLLLLLLLLFFNFLIFIYTSTRSSRIDFSDVVGEL